MPKDPAEAFEDEWTRSLSQPETSFLIPAEGPEFEASLTSGLEQFLVLVAQFQQQGRVAKSDYDKIVTRVSDLKVVLDRIGDRGLMEQDMARRY
jgi:hypothetical protein